MNKYSVPEEIRKLKPKGTMVKALNGRYYVYEYSCVKIDEKWKTKTGKLIGTISYGVGFTPNDNYKKEERLTSFDFGQYFITYNLGISVYKKLKEFFDPKEATEIYLLSIMHFVNGFTYAKYLKPHYDMSYFSKHFPTISLSEYKVTQLLEKLGHYTENVEKFQQSLINECSKKIVVDEYLIKSSSMNNGLTEKDYKVKEFKETQINTLIAYDIENNRPVCSRFYQDLSVDCVTFKDIFDRFDFENTLFVIDKEFNTEENLALCSQNGNKFVVPLKSSTDEYKELIKNAKFEEAFVYEKDKTSLVIYYAPCTINGIQTYIFKDFNAALLEKKDYLSKIGLKAIYTNEKFEELKDTFGVIILQTNLIDKTPEEIYKIYKDRWNINKFNNYYRNRLEFDATYIEDYYRSQGLSFILLISSLIYSEFVSKIKDLNMSVNDILFDTEFIRVHYKKAGWEFDNLTKKHLDLYKKLGFNVYDELKYLNNLPEN